MRAVVVIGDELTCAGFRLAGADMVTPSAEDVVPAIEQALGDAQLVVLTAPIAALLAPAALRAMQARESPLVVVLPAIAQPEFFPGQGPRIRALLGIEG